MEGYWLTHYDAGKAHGDGVAMLHAGELLGGDAEHLWSGTCEENHRLHLRVRIVPRVSRTEEETMAREKPMLLSLDGCCTEHFARLEGHPDGREDLFIQVMLRKCRASHAVEELTKEAAAEANDESGRLSGRQEAGSGQEQTVVSRICQLQADTGHPEPGTLNPEP